MNFTKRFELFGAALLPALMAAAPSAALGGAEEIRS
jgi:hypothetical protein